MATRAIIPIRSFDGLTRLAPVLDAAERAQLMQRLSGHVVSTGAAAGLSVTVVTGDVVVAGWADGLGCRVVAEPEPPGLDAAAAAGIAGWDGPWMVVHADLPTLTRQDLDAAVTGLERAGAVIAPSHDGGTSLLGATSSPFRFAYGVGSFRRHLASIPDAAVVVRQGLALDIDQVRDLVALRTVASL